MGTKVAHAHGVINDNVWILFPYPGKAYIRRNYDPSAPGLEGLQWDKAELFEVP